MIDRVFKSLANLPMIDEDKVIRSNRAAWEKKKADWKMEMDMGILRKYVEV